MFYKKKPKVNYTFEYDPQKDITAYELALILKVYDGSRSGYLKVEDSIAEIKEAKVERHFIIGEGPKVPVPGLMKEI